MNENLDNFADAYNDDFKYALDNELLIPAYARSVASKMRGGSVLELGIGHGYTAECFKTRALRYVVVEGSEKIIIKFKSRYEHSGMEIRHCLFEEFNTSEKFDTIAMGFVLEHVEDPDLIVSKFKGLLAENGKLFIAVPNSEALNRRFGFEAGMLESLDMLSESDRKLGHKRYFNLKSLEALVRRHRLRPASVEGLFLKPITTDQIKALNLSRDILAAMMKVGVKYPELCVAILMELEHAV